MGRSRNTGDVVMYIDRILVLIDVQCMKTVTLNSL